MKSRASFYFFYVCIIDYINCDLHEGYFDKSNLHVGHFYVFLAF